jgi:uncharacterized repeat protein (TIGR03803 family)
VFKTLITLIAFCSATFITLPAQTFTTLVEFDGKNGASPVSMSLIQGVNGDLYGTTLQGGANCPPGGCGTVFQLSPKGLKTLYSLCALPSCTDGADPNAGLTQGTDGNFYGTNSSGGDFQFGTVFKITPTGTLTILHSFCITQTNCSDGAVPAGSLIQAIDGDFYGTTTAGGGVGPGCLIGGGCGTVFKMTSLGTLTTLHVFCSKGKCPDGAGPSTALVQATDGNFYGTTSTGGNTRCQAPYGCGTVFRMNPTGKLTTIHTFCSQPDCTDGAIPLGVLVQGVDGNLYGTTEGFGNGGTAFKITPDGTLTTIYTFCSLPGCSDGGGPVAGLIQATDGNFYGTTDGGGINGCSCGTIFTITSGGVLTTLHSFDGADGSHPYGSLFQSTNGSFYGATVNGGPYSCPDDPTCGTLYSLSTGLSPFVAFVRGSSKAGQSFGILGQGFTGTTSAALNGTPMSFTVVSDTFIKATVPAGATTGYVTVATPSGTLTSNVPFHVLN